MAGLKVNKNTKRVNFYFHPHLYIPYNEIQTSDVRPKLKLWTPEQKMSYL